MRDPERILVNRESLTLEGIKQFYVAMELEKYKLDCLCDLYESLSISQCIIFVNNRKKVEWLSEQMDARDFTVSSIHAEMNQSERSSIMSQFRTGSSRVLIATDVIARGIDVQQVSLVVNFELPTQKENYIHRIGRSGRYGRKGVAINLISGDEVRQMKEIEGYYSTIVDTLPENLATIAL